MTPLTLHITGMSCGHCLHAVNDALVSLPGVHLESLRMGRAEVRYDEQVTSPAAIEAAIADAGYHASSAAPRAFTGEQT
ncbi:MAG TPA: cation transporter [Gemmatimonadales bacterium]|nr:cation transporter [Gemmatimonadales bacterium]